MASPAATNTTPRRRHSTTNAGEWAAVPSAGASMTVEKISKHQLMRRTGLPARDLRDLDPALSSYSYRSSIIMARDRALVVNLDRVRAVITADEVLVPCPRDPAVAPLVGELRARLMMSASSPAAASPSPPPPQEAEEEGKDGRSSGSDKVLPFEFRALEVCLQFACKSFEHETSVLEKEAYPALDELSSNVSTLILERVRQIKSRLVATSGKVQKVRDELEHLLDDDMDMAAMYLTEKLARQAAGYSARFNAKNEFYEERGHEAKEGEEGASEGGSNGSEISTGFSPKIDELENLLEAYFVQIDGTLNKLSTLREYVDDTEDYINIMQDDKQNQLLRMGAMLSTAALVLNAGVAVTGVFGMNINIALFKTTDMAVFWQATGGIIGAGAAIYLLALLFYRGSGIL